MKYTRLTKEQLEELHREFINFLAAQTITVQEWDAIKKDKPEVAEQELDVFSDLIWEGVLSKAEFLENISNHQLFLFKLEETSMRLIVVKVTDTSIDLTTSEGYKWLQQNFTSDEVEFLQASKEYSEDKHKDIFELVQQGSVITKGDLYQFFERLVNN
ncbi:MAG: DUF6495 family protein [Altibacter sp.]|uniref:DUF6495 family protein n=1 Tax=Altibacter sp. TaxID=2024823 RepID=UPI001D40A074|nr:DUF6495 family protein [Altibacter sp.]MBZ0327094.1 DUF6495 family protein [Altibacter sp.]